MTYVKKYNNENNNFTHVLGITHDKHVISVPLFTHRR